MPGVNKYDRQTGMPFGTCADGIDLRDPHSAPCQPLEGKGRQTWSVLGIADLNTLHSGDRILCEVAYGIVRYQPEVGRHSGATAALLGGRPPGAQMSVVQEICVRDLWANSHVAYLAGNVGLQLDLSSIK